MMQVLHTFKGSYPFGLKKESQNTFMQLIKQNVSEQQISLLKQMTKIYKNNTNPHFIKLIKMLREDNKIYFIYQYQEISLLHFITQISKNMEGNFTKEKYKALFFQFKFNIDSIIEGLIKLQIKVDILLANIAFTPKINKQDGFILKLFVDMDAQYLSLIDHNYRPKESKKKDRSGLNQQYLQQYYQAERKRLMMNFQQLLQKNFGKIHDNSQKKQFPNFIIKGTKLIFVSNDEKDKEGSKDKDNSIEGNKSSQRLSVKESKKEEENSSSNQEIQIRQKLVKNEQSNNERDNKKNHPQTPIIDFDQSFQPEFKPEEFTKQKTYIYQENDYLQSLQEQLTKIAQKKVTPQIKKQQPQPQKIQKKNQVEVKKAEEVKIHQKKEIKPIDLTISQGSTQSNPNNVSHNKSKDNASSNNDSYSYEKKDDKKDKQSKLNKYKMKIITSHQIQIQGGQEPNVEEIQKQIIQGIRTGKISINDLANNNDQKFRVTTKNDQQNLRKDSTTPDLYRSDHKEEEKDKQAVEDKQKMTNSQNLKKNIHQHHPKESTVKQIPLAKMKTVNQIIQRLGLKGKNQSNTQGTKQRQGSELTKKNLHQYLQNATTPMHKVEKNQQVEHLEKHQKKPHLEKVQKVQQKEFNQEKPQKTENYLTKIKEAKTKAEQLLKQYTKKKQ